MAVAHGRSVFETNKLNNCPVLNIYVFPYVQGPFFSETQHISSFLKHRDLFLFHTQLFHWRREQKPNCWSAAVIDPLHFGFCIHLLFLHTTTIDETALWISEFPRFEHI